MLYGAARLMKKVIAFLFTCRWLWCFGAAGFVLEVCEGEAAASVHCMVHAVGFYRFLPLGFMSERKNREPF